MAAIVKVEFTLCFRMIPPPFLGSMP